MDAKKTQAKQAASKSKRGKSGSKRGPITPCSAMKCEEVLASLDPPVVSGTYSDMKKIKMKGFQREHFIPNSNFMEGPGRKGQTIDGMGNYNEDGAFTYFVFDDQSQGTEHKNLTDRERAFAKKLKADREKATVTKWLDHMEQQTAESMMDRVKRSSRKRSARASDEQKAKEAARCLRQAAEQRLVDMGVDLEKPMRNGQAGGKPPSSDKSGKSIDQSF